MPSQRVLTNKKQLPDPELHHMLLQTVLTVFRQYIPLQYMLFYFHKRNHEQIQFHPNHRNHLNSQLHASIWTSLSYSPQRHPNYWNKP